MCVACESGPIQPPDPDPTFAISDGSQGGNDHFFWLPPIAPGRSYGGTFVGTLSPVVRICDWTDTCGATVLEFGRTYGPAAHRVGVDVKGQHYHLNLDVGAFPELAPGTTYRISVLLGVEELGFADVQLAENGQAFKDLKTQEIIGLTDGRTFPIKFRIEEELIDFDAFSIAFHTQRDGNYEVYLSDASGNLLINISDNPALDGTPTWSPDGQRIAFMSDRHDPGGTPDIYVMNVDGTEVQRVTYLGGWKPAWSPDGSVIAFQRGWPPSSRSQDIWLVDPEEGSETQVTDVGCDPDHWEDIDPTWGPGIGGPPALVFARGDNETGNGECGNPILPIPSFPPVVPTSFDLVIWPAPEFPGLVNITRNQTHDQMSPAVHREGGRFVFAQRTGDETSDLWIQDAPSSTPRQLNPSGWINQEPDWAHGASNILFTRGPTEQDLGLWVMTLDGTYSFVSMTQLIPDAGWGRYRPPGGPWSRRRVRNVKSPWAPTAPRTVPEPVGGPRAVHRTRRSMVAAGLEPATSTM
ncbi:MAG TPA: hypothetical protein VLA36_12220 [Longimicrobiales bacterium]|nr:hypothetical protein [Longimicrobiales bacterium]